jgi:hypothetical protein
MQSGVARLAHLDDNRNTHADAAAGEGVACGSAAVPEAAGTASGAAADAAGADTGLKVPSGLICATPVKVLRVLGRPAPKQDPLLENAGVPALHLS